MKLIMIRARINTNKNRSELASWKDGIAETMSKSIDGQGQSSVYVNRKIVEIHATHSSKPNFF